MRVLVWARASRVAQCMILWNSTPNKFKSALTGNSDQVVQADPDGTQIIQLTDPSACLAALGSAAHARQRAPAQPRACGAAWMEAGGRAPSASRAAAACAAARRLVPRGLGASRPGRWKSGASASRRQAVDAASADARRSPPSRPSVTCACESRARLGHHLASPHLRCSAHRARGCARPLAGPKAQHILLSRAPRG